jgi:hypothetical protein
MGLWMGSVREDRIAGGVSGTPEPIAVHDSEVATTVGKQEKRDTFAASGSSSILQ